VTGGGFYDVAVILSFVGLVAVFGSWCWGRWRKMRDRRVLLRLVWTDPAFRKFEDEMREFQATVGAAMVGPASRMATQLNALARSFESSCAPPGTVANPSDPSPQPRRTR
jgi:hypothetical protein